ncbi:ABC transporter ATP-binding protein [Bordetella genomosp. 10]|uniref:ABC transporter ATP-binding protein n=1 Tax=Bordetella genomosp. 10 TaxID=1416804 RepID=A0A261SLK3_9BORD|nr:ABC transporter ATP-binding protein [Bordetella genomosp. 10]OZI38035.1 ABC transporter ATP-binding protein [Bordetella genomosp. 10]
MTASASAYALDVDKVASGYKSSIVLQDVSLSIRPGESIALLGKNGMGKSTLLKTIMGYLPKKRGSVRLGGRDATRLPPYQIARCGVAYAAQEQPLFQDLSIRDNLRLGLASDGQFDERFDGVTAVFPVFRTRLRQHAGTLSGGEQKMLLVARALMMQPTLLLLDEITEGLQPSVIDTLAQALLWERERRGTTMLIVEQNVAFALKVADRYVILKQGSIVDEGQVREADAAARIFEHLKV